MSGLRCDGPSSDVEQVSMLDSRGFVYCAHHGLGMRGYYAKVRKLRAYELRRLERGEQVSRY